jgi:hypothetical protein
MLRFNSDKFDFWPIYDSIKRFYPIGIANDNPHLFNSYPGIKELNAIIGDNIHNSEHLNSRWRDFTIELENRIQKPIRGTTFLQPCFSSCIEMGTFSFDNFTRTKELHFFVSLLGPFYSIIGHDWNVLKVNNRNYISSNYLVVSPENEYATDFLILSGEIEKRFNGFRFVPFDIVAEVIEGLDVRYANRHCNTVFTALFNSHIDLSIRTLGNDLYKSEDWIREGYVDKGGWTSYPPDSFPPDYKD